MANPIRVRNNKKYIKSIIFMALIHKIFFLLFISFIFCYQISAKTLDDLDGKKYEAIVLGKIIHEKVIKINNYYLTEYKLKVNKWIYKKPYIKKKKIVKIRILGANLPKKGIIIKASTSPDSITLKKEAVFYLEKTNTKHNNVFTLSKEGIDTDIKSYKHVNN